MATLNTMTEIERNALGDRFLRSLVASHRIFGEFAFRKPRLKNKLPVNKALFEVWTVTMDKLTDDAIAILEQRSSQVIQNIDGFMRGDTDFLNAVSQGTGDAAKVRLRFQRFRKIIEDNLS
jgi:hypothetical protein